LLDGDALRKEAGFSGKPKYGLALPQFVADLRQELDFCWTARLLLCPHQLVRPANQQKDEEGKDQEIDHDRHELPPAEHWGTRFLEVGIAGERAVIALGH